MDTRVAVIAIIVEVLGLPVLPFSIGLYLPIHLSVPMMIGGGVRWLVERKREGEEQKQAVENGVLYCSGLIAGEGLVGILLAVCAIIPLADGSNLGSRIASFLPGLLPFLRNVNSGNVIGMLAFALLAFSLWKCCVRKGVQEQRSGK